MEAVVLAEKLRQRDSRALARSITLAENDPRRALDLLEQLGPVAHRAWVLGITGPPGVGKSTLVGQLIRRAVEARLALAVLAVDPSSPFSHGALLADRLRMGVDGLAPESVFVRSLSNRGASGGLSPGLRLALRFLSHYGFDLIVVETVGIGQSEVDVMHVADCVAVVLMASLGDEIQAMKSGVMEIADLYVVNKCCTPGTDRFVSHLNASFADSPKYGDPARQRPAIFLTDAIERRGLDELWEHFDGVRRNACCDSGEQRTMPRADCLIMERLVDRFREDATSVMRGIDPSSCSIDEVYGLIARRMTEPSPGVGRGSLGREVGGKTDAEEN